MDDRNPALFNLHHTSFLVSPIRVNGVDVCYCYQQVGLTKWTQNIGCNVQLFFSCLLFTCYNAKHCSIQHRLRYCSRCLVIWMFYSTTIWSVSIQIILIEAPGHVQPAMGWFPVLSKPEDFSTVTTKRVSSATGPICRFFVTTYVSLSSVHCHLDCNRLH